MIQQKEKHKEFCKLYALGKSQNEIAKLLILKTKKVASRKATLRNAKNEFLTKLEKQNYENIHTKPKHRFNSSYRRK